MSPGCIRSIIYVVDAFDDLLDRIMCQWVQWYIGSKDVIFRWMYWWHDALDALILLLLINMCTWLIHTWHDSLDVLLDAFILVSHDSLNSFMLIHTFITRLIDTCITRLIAFIYSHWMHWCFYHMTRGGGLGSRPKNMYGETLGDGVEYHLMKPTPRR